MLVCVGSNKIGWNSRSKPRGAKHWRGQTNLLARQRQTDEQCTQEYTPRRPRDVISEVLTEELWIRDRIEDGDRARAAAIALGHLVSNGEPPMSPPTLPRGMLVCVGSNKIGWNSRSKPRGAKHWRGQTNLLARQRTDEVGNRKAAHFHHLVAQPPHAARMLDAVGLRKSQVTVDVGAYVVGIEMHRVEARRKLRTGRADHRHPASLGAAKPSRRPCPSPANPSYARGTRAEPVVRCRAPGLCRRPS